MFKYILLAIAAATAVFFFVFDIALTNEIIGRMFIAGILGCLAFFLLFCAEPIRAFVLLLRLRIQESAESTDGADVREERKRPGRCRAVSQFRSLIADVCAQDSSFALFRERSVPGKTEGQNQGSRIDQAGSAPAAEQGNRNPREDQGHIGGKGPRQ